MPTTLSPEVANPYAAPTTAVEGVADVKDTGLDALRRAHIAAEANIKSIGFLNVLSGVLIGVSGVIVMVQALGGKVSALLGGIGVFYGLAAAALLLTGVWLRRLDPRGRTMATVLMAISLLGVLAGGVTAISSLLWGGLVTASLWSRKARTVFGEHYRNVVIPATPDVKYRTPVWIWLALVFMLLSGLAFVANRWH